MQDQFVFRMMVLFSKQPFKTCICSHLSQTNLNCTIFSSNFSNSCIETCKNGPGQEANTRAL